MARPSVDGERETDRGLPDPLAEANDADLAEMRPPSDSADEPAPVVPTALASDEGGEADRLDQERTVPLDEDEWR